MTRLNYSLPYDGISYCLPGQYTFGFTHSSSQWWYLTAVSQWLMEPLGGRVLCGGIALHTAGCWLLLASSPGWRGFPSIMNPDVSDVAHTTGGTRRLVTPPHTHSTPSQLSPVDGHRMFLPSCCSEQDAMVSIKCVLVFLCMVNFLKWDEQGHRCHPDLMRHKPLWEPT